MLKQITTLIDKDLPFDQSIARLRKMCERASNPHIAKAVFQLDFGSDAQRIQKWIESILADVHARPIVTALDVAIVSPSIKGVARFDLEAEYYRSFKRENLSWLNQDNRDRRFAKLAKSHVLKNVYAICDEYGREKTHVADLEYLFGLGFSAISLKTAFKAIAEKRTWKRSLGVSLGWSGGDVVLLGQLTRKGWAVIKDYDNQIVC